MTVAFVEQATARVRASTWLPVLGRPERVLDRTLSGVGPHLCHLGVRRLARPLAAAARGVAPGHRLRGDGGRRLRLRRRGPRAVGLPRDPRPARPGAHASSSRSSSAWGSSGRSSTRGGSWAGRTTSAAPSGWSRRRRRSGPSSSSSPCSSRGRCSSSAAASACSPSAPSAPSRAGCRTGSRSSSASASSPSLFWGLWTGVIVRGFFAGANAVFAPQDTNGTIQQRPSLGARAVGHRRSR